MWKYSVCLAEALRKKKTINSDLYISLVLFNFEISTLEIKIHFFSGII